jgi:hypothetical protein
MFVANGHSWNISIYIQAILILSTLIVFLFVPEKYSDITQAIELKKIEEEENRVQIK